MKDVLLVSVGSTAGLREADAELAESLRRAGASVVNAVARAPRDVRTLALTELLWAAAAGRAAARESSAARAVVYCTTTAALLSKRPGAIRFDAPAAGNRPGRHGIWQRPTERRRFAAAELLLPWSQAGLAEAPRVDTPALVIPVPVEASGDPEDRDIAAITYGGNPVKKGLDRVLAAWATARREGEELVVAGVGEAEVRTRFGLQVAAAPGVRYAGRLRRAEYRGLVRRSRVFVTAPRREDYGIAQLEALADGTQLVTTAAPGPYVALALARSLDERLVGEDLASAVRAALDSPVDDYAGAARDALGPWRRPAVDTIVAERLLPALLHRG